MDIWGVDGAAAEAEALAAMVSFMESVGLTSDDVGIKVNSRAVLAELLARTCGVDAARPRQQLRQHGARVDLDAHVVRGQADALHERDHGRQGLRLRRGAVDAPDVHVPPATASRSFASVPPLARRRADAAPPGRLDA